MGTGQTRKRTHGYAGKLPRPADPGPVGQAECRLSPAPFPHMVSDDLVSTGLIAAARAEMLTLWRDNVPGWQRWANAHELKHSLDWSHVPPDAALNTVREWLTAEATCKALAELFGIGDRLTPDGLGGGLHVIPVGGHLGVHVDFNTHPLPGLYRRLNVLLYVHGEPGCGGDLELHPAGGVPTVIGLRPGRLVAFATSETSWHGHPRPYKPVDGLPRLSLACYYFTPIEPAGFGSAHSTVFA